MTKLEVLSSADAERAYCAIELNEALTVERFAALIDEFVELHGVAPGFVVFSPIDYAIYEPAWKSTGSPPRSFRIIVMPSLKTGVIVFGYAEKAPPQ